MPTTSKLVCFLIVLLVSNLKSQEPSTAPANTVSTSDLRTILGSNRFLRGSSGEEVIKTLASLQDQIFVNGGCGVKLCFGLDGTGLISSEEIRLQRDLCSLC